MDFIAIGDTTVDEFIRLKEARINCDINNEDCTISMKWGDKIPYEFSVLVPGVGNAANAAVAAARLGLSAGFISNIGKDRYGEQILASFAREGVDARFVVAHDTIPTNHHYVLWYEAERTILIRHEDYPYAIPEGFAAPKWIYLSSSGERSEAFHGKLAMWLLEHPETKLAFQPGTFQMSMGKKKLAPLYAATELVACNKEEAERILEVGATDIKELLAKMRELGPKIAIITDGPNGAYCYDGTEMLKAPMYPDPKPPLERTGAGDAATSTIVVALALGKPLSEALLWGLVNSMSVVQEIGAQKGLLSREAIEKYLADAPMEYRATPL
ncbi:carbohydrate kinase family protein [Patescibacteria group bacterium]|nr:carbohydrate kinase family protein [Patescibacteria group bacterium]MDE2173424.1 carbohydrate kinase family protein [Patescibacteria group bacterium]